jgi:arylsulfatase A-like enzyme
VLFLSDNGPLPTFGGQRTVGLRGSKLSLYEGGIRVPAIAWGPGLVAPGVVNETTVLSGVDLLPSLAALCGVPLPRGYSSDGQDLSEALRGRSPKRSRPLYWEYGRNPTSFAYPQGRDRSPQLALLEGDWKLLLDADGSGAQLYDLATDPAESTDRAATEPERVRRMSERALAQRREWP